MSHININETASGIMWYG